MKQILIFEMDINALTPFERLPAEMGRNIFYSLSDNDLNSLCLLSRSLFQLVKNTGLWADRAKNADFSLKWSFAKEAFDSDKTNYAITKVFFNYLEHRSLFLRARLSPISETDKEIYEKEFKLTIKKIFKTILKTVPVIKNVIKSDFLGIGKIPNSLKEKMISDCIPDEFSGDLFAYARFFQNESKNDAAIYYCQFFKRSVAKIPNHIFYDIEMFMSKVNADLRLKFYQFAIPSIDNREHLNRVLKNAGHAAWCALQLQESAELFDQIITLAKEHNDIEVLDLTLINASQQQLILNNFGKAKVLLSEVSTEYAPLVKKKLQRLNLIESHQISFTQNKFEDIPGKVLLLFALKERHSSLERASALFEEAFKKPLKPRLLRKCKKAAIVEIKLQNWNKAGDYLSLASSIQI